MVEGKDNNSTEGKGKLVKQLFEDIAPKYDWINRIISFGCIHRWRKKLVEIANPSPNAKILDLCAGTGKVTQLLAENSTNSQITAVDFCPQMIAQAKKNLPEKYEERVDFQVGDVTNLIFKDSTFDLVVIAFGLRNVEDINLALAEMNRVTKPGGKLLSLDLAKPQKAIFKSLYYGYFNFVLPLLGMLFHGEKKPYSYLAESLKDFPNQEVLKEKFINLGLKDVEYFELTGGITAVHFGRKNKNI